MLVLALDTTTRAGSAAVVKDGVVLSEVIGDPALTHGARLPSDLIRALDAAAVTSAAIDLLAVAAGPGSFTGLRVGIAAMQGLSMATSRPIVPISALDALAMTGAGEGASIAVWMDAQRGEVFAALYEPDGTSLSVEPTALSPSATLAHWRERGVNARPRFVGDGAVRYASIVREAFGASIAIVEPPPLASIIGRLAGADPSRAVQPHAVVPIYIRRPDAEIARARQQEEA